MEWRCGRFGIIRKDSSSVWSSKDGIPDRRWLLGYRVSKGSDMTCRFCACSCVLTCAQNMMKVWAAEWSEWLWCQTLTSCGFSCPSRRMYLKFDSVPQISHVAYICAEIPPRAIGCFEMDVNMKLFAIYLRPFGCLYSVTALQGHRRKGIKTCSNGGLFIPLWSLCVWKWVKDKKDKDKFHNTSAFVDVAN